MGTGIHRLLLNQLLLVGLAAAVFLVIFDTDYAASAVYGGSIAAMNALLVARCARRDAQAPERTPQQSLAAIYICVIQRFVMAAVLFALGLGAMQLEPLALLAGFIAGQLAMVIFGTQQIKQK